MIYQKVVVIIFLNLLSLLSAGQISSTSLRSNKSYTIAFTLTEYNNISIPAILNKTDTVNLMFHTAANSVTLTEASVKKLHSIRFSETTDSIKSWGGQSNASRTSLHNAVQIGDLTWEDVSLFENVNSGQYTDGKFGPDLFKGRVIEIDFDKHLIILHADLPKKSKKYEKIGLTLQDDMMYLHADCTIEGSIFQNKYLIHSGYSGAILFDDKFASDNQLTERLTITGEKSLKDSYGNILKTKQAVLPKFNIQKISLSNVPVGFFEGAIGRQKMSVIGGDILKRFNIIIDSKREFIYLKPNNLNDAEYRKM